MTANGPRFVQLVPVTRRATEEDGAAVVVKYHKGNTLAISKEVLEEQIFEQDVSEAAQIDLFLSIAMNNRRRH
jgi:hypothetical protein